jgi:hypothetical protein
MDKLQEEGAPASRKVFLGVMYDWLTGMKSITPEKRDFSISELRRISSSPTVSFEAWRSCIFRINHMATVVPNLRLFLNSSFIALRGAERTSSNITMNSLLEIDVKTIIRLMTDNGGKEVAIRTPVTSAPDRTFYSDSSNKGVGGWHWTDASHTEVALFYGLWTKEETMWLDITTLEGLGTLACLLTFDTAPFSSILCMGDNLNVTNAWASLAARNPLAPVLREMFCVQARLQISLRTEWVARKGNQVADLLSKGDRKKALAKLGNPLWIRKAFPQEIHRIADKAITCARGIAESKPEQEFTSGVQKVTVAAATRHSELA